MEEDAKVCVCHLAKWKTEQRAAKVEGQNYSEEAVLWCKEK